MRFSALIAAASAAVLISASDDAGRPENQTVRINILSKHIRQISGGDIPPLELKFRGNALLTGRYSERAVKNIVIKTIEGRAGIIADDEMQSTDSPVIIKSADGNSDEKFFTCVISGEQRKYPLPLEINFKNGTPELIITEKINRYALSSAAAEMGYVPPESAEALHALALAVLARSQVKKKYAHEKYDFCDLTHCQVYRGIVSAEPEVYSSLIDIEKSGNEFLFHSSCGGKTCGPAVFTLGGGSSGSIKDILFKEKINLCGDAKDIWHREISSARLFEILYEESGGDAEIIYDNKIPLITISRGQKIIYTAPEEFRLKINRVLGWNFIRSNNYTLTRAEKSGNKFYRFEGKGLGHGTGLCQKGAVELARRGFSRYEILYHYYPSMIVKPAVKEKFRSPNLGWMIFDLNSGKDISLSNNSIRNRKISPGSVFKLMTSLYLAYKRPDLLTGYEYECRGKSRDKELIDRCWFPEGHGKVGAEKAITMSCNLYFSSLTKKIDMKDFVEFCNSFFSDAGMDCRVNPPSAENRAKFTVGLDDSFLFSINDFAILTGFLFADNPADKKIRALRMRIPRDHLELIRKGAAAVFITGTASSKLKEFGPGINRIGLQKLPYADNIAGKTSTTIDGTDHPVIYGVFIGAENGIGIVTLLRNGNGHLAARWAQELLHRE